MIDTTAQTIAANKGSNVFPSFVGGNNSAQPSTAATYAQGANPGGQGAVKYNSNTGALLSPGESFTLPTQLPNLAAQTTSTATATTPVVTADAAQKNYTNALTNFQQLTDAVKNQKSVLAQQAAQKAADDAQKQVEIAKQQLEQQKLGIQQQQADTAQQDTEAKRQALAAANGQPTTQTNTAPAQTSSDVANAGLNQAVNDKLTGLQEIQNTRDQLTQQSNQSLQSLLQGTIPLSAPQQALITSLQNQLIQNENDQKQANNSFVGVVTEEQFRAGGEYTPGQMAGQIHNAVSVGVAKIQALDNAAAKTMAELEQSFQKDNYDIINKQLDNLNKTLDQKADSIKDTYATVTTAIKDERDFNYKAQQDSFQQQMASDKFSYQQKQDAIQNAFTRGQINETQRHNLAMESIQREPSAADKKAAEAALKNAKTSIPIMQDKITSVDTLLNHAGLNSRVGPNPLTRSPIGTKGIIASGVAGAVAGGVAGGTLGLGIGALPGAVVGGVLGAGVSAARGLGDNLTGAGQDFSAGVHKLTAGLSLQALEEAKAQGATFGALSDAEMRILSNSATTLNDWEIKDSQGRPTGVWNIDENSFKKELKNIQDLTKRALVLSNESLVNSGESSQLDQIFSPANRPVDPSTYY